MSATSAYMASTSFPMLQRRNCNKTTQKTKLVFSFSTTRRSGPVGCPGTRYTSRRGINQKQEVAAMKQLRPVEKQLNVKSKNMGKEYGSKWLSSTTRHVRIFAAYINPETCEFDQTQTDKLMLILDLTDEFVWTDTTCNKFYSYFQELVDYYEIISYISVSCKDKHNVCHSCTSDMDVLCCAVMKHGAELTKYTLRLIGSEIEHYIRKMLYQGEIQYNMEAMVLNFSMGKPLVGFNYDGRLQQAE